MTEKNNATNKDEKKETHVSNAYSKQQFLSAKKFARQKDLIDALLVDGQAYTTDQVTKIVEDFLKKGAE